MAKPIKVKVVPIIPKVTPSAKVTNQKSSGRCWLFAALNVIRRPMMEKYLLKDFEFSQNYLFFWDKLERFNYNLECIIETKNDVEAQLNNPASQSINEEHRNDNFFPFSQKNKIQIYMAQDKSGKPYQYLSFLFYTQETERYNILLHIKDKVNHDFSLSSDLKDDKDKDEEKALNLKGKRL